ncbi:hypothetical protein [Mixta mediterraneensis]|uniref:hypothetical protein n=1 Tax=Mixta mediterraneensis TaxID=2758443 RepID=UPI001875168A|nr:hypothetical protein [Mixta mediterraneensis]MBE5251320.1 hypothetical protein [Mixta mediterraneensis]
MSDQFEGFSAFSPKRFGLALLLQQKSVSNHSAATSANACKISMFANTNSQQI